MIDDESKTNGLFWQSMDFKFVAGSDGMHRILDAKLYDRLHQKQGRSIARWSLRTDWRQIVCYVKRHFRHSWLRSLSTYLLPSLFCSDGRREWYNLQRARDAGVPTPRHLAMAEWRVRPFRLQSVLVLEELKDFMALHEAIPRAMEVQTPDQFAKWKSSLILEMSRVVKLLHDRCYFHQDLYLCHFFIRIEDIGHRPPSWEGRVVLIDFHRLTSRRMLPALGRIKDLAQLLFSSDVPGVSIRDKVRFRRAYGISVIFQALIRLKAERYRAHNERQKGQ